MFHACVLTRCHVCVCVYRWTTRSLRPADHAHTHTAAPQQAISMDLWKGTFRAKRPNAPHLIRHFSPSRLAPVKLHRLIRSWWETWQANFWFPNILSLLSESFYFVISSVTRPSSSPLLLACCQNPASDEQWLKFPDREVKVFFWQSHARHHVPEMLCIEVHESHSNIAGVCTNVYCIPS